MPRGSLRTLLKIQLLGAFGIGTIVNSRSTKGMAKLIGAAAGLVFLALFLAAYSFAVGIVMVMSRAVDAIPPFAVIACGLASVVSLFTKANGALFNVGNIDMVVSMPIPMWKIVVSRVAPMYGMSLALCLLVGLPMMGIYFTHVGAGPIEVLTEMLLLFFTPAIPMAIALAVSFLVAWATSRTPFADKALSVLNAAVTIALIVAIFALQINLNDVDDIDLQTIEGYASGFQVHLASIWPPSAWAEEALQGNVLYLLLFVGVSLTTLVAMLIVLSKTLLGINTLLASGAARRRSRRGEHGRAKAQTANTPAGVSKGIPKGRSLFGALLVKEFKLWAGTSAFFSNTVIGPVLCMIVGVGVAVVGPESISSLIASNEEYFVFADDLVIVLIPWVMGFCCEMTVLTACSTSLEGKMRWIAQTAPIPSSTVIGAKIVFQLLVTIPAAMIAGAIIAISSALSAMDVILLFLIPIAFGTYSACLGAFLDVRKPKYEWASVYEVVKRSPNVSIVAISGIILLFGGIAVTLAIGENWRLPGLAFGIILLAVSALLARAAMRRSLQDR